MANDDFQPEKRDIEELFVGADYYVIPRFQRPYSWNRENLEDFWRDVVIDNGVGYFIGPMVAWRDKTSSIRRLVDGQQRLTTIALMFAVLRDQLTALSEQKLAEGIHRYLEKSNRDNELEFTLQTETEAQYLSQGILKNPPDRSVEPHSEEEEALAHAYTQIEKHIADGVAGRSDPRTWLTDIRDRLLGLRVIWIEHGNEDDAYTIFETLNSRGKDLEVVDLLKNHLFNKLRGTKNTQADTIRSRWNTMRAQLEGDDTRDRLDVNRFILHWWLSQEEYVAQRKLFRHIKDAVKTMPQAESRLGSLERDAPLYRAALEPSSRAWLKEEKEVQRSLQALVDFRVVQPAPLLLSLLRARGLPSDKLKATPLKAAVQTIEHYHFQYTVVSQLSSSGGVSEMYAKAARDLSQAQSSHDRAAALTDIKGKLIDRKPDRSTFINAFVTRFEFTNANTRDSKLIRYVLVRFLRHLNPTTNLEGLTIEHILPQQQISRIVDGESVIGSVGNLLLVSESLNGDLDNKDFVTKKKILTDRGAVYDIGGVLDQAAWGPLEIQDRAIMLAELAYDAVWKLPV